MEGSKYLIIITLIDGQNFALPDGVPDKVEAHVFAEARFGNESILKSDPIRLTNSNPEFVTELAWQLDKRSLHQLRVERRAIKLQIFMQTQERRKSVRQTNEISSNGLESKNSSATNKIELVGYTVIDIRSAQERGEPKYKWLPLLNPKFRKSSYNRPEVQLALTLSRIDDNTNNDANNCTNISLPVNNTDKNMTESQDWLSDSHESDAESSIDSRLYKTCLDITLNPEDKDKGEIIENDIRIQSKNGCFYIYDARDPNKSTLEDCDERYSITVNIPFSSGLDFFIEDPDEYYYFSVCLFGASLKTELFSKPSSATIESLQFNISTTHSSMLTTYFQLNSNLVIKLHQSVGKPLGIASIQLDQLCNPDTKCRSLEGIFALQSLNSVEPTSSSQPSIGVAVVLERVHSDLVEPIELVSDDHIEMAKEHFGDDIDEYLFKTLNDTHQLTLDNETAHVFSDLDAPTIQPLVDSSRQDDHHFCFTIDLKHFSYTPSQRLIPTLRELVVRYSYQFFGYKDTITTDASIPISPTKSIIISGFCEFNFATNASSLLTALQEIPLNLYILACEQIKRPETVTNEDKERIIATCNLNLAKTLQLDEYNINQLQNRPASTTVSAPILGSDGIEIGELQMYLCLRDLGRPSYSLKMSTENLVGTSVEDKDKTLALPLNARKLDAFIQEAKSNLETWKNDHFSKLSEEIRKRENEKLKRICHRLEAKEAKRDQDFKKKMEDLASLEKMFKNSLIDLESLEKRLSKDFEQLKTRDALLDTRLDTLDLKVSKALHDIKFESEKRFVHSGKTQRSFDEKPLEVKNLIRTSIKSNSEAGQLRRSSLKSNNNVGIPLPVRSSSLVRGVTDGSSTRFVKRATNVVTTVVNGTGSRPRSNSTRLNLSKETQEKLISLRKEKAELLKRGCRPNDELILEINSLIEKLAC